MSVIAILRDQWTFQRTRTLATLDAVAQLPDPARALGWRPGPGRAHIGWQLMHVAITEELFATERLKGTAPAYADLIPRFKGGSTPDDNVPTIDQIRETLDATRDHLKATIATFTEADLPIVPEPLKERGWSLERVLQVLSWHEPHHQGQAHITLNLFKAANA